MAVIVQRVGRLLPRLSYKIQTRTGIHIEKFSLGQVVATPGLIAAAEAAQDDVQKYLQQHAKGDWGEVSRNDRRANDDALANGERLFSSYHLGDGTKIWIITEADRSVTTLLLPEEH